MRVLEAKFVQGFMRMADDGWNQGWHERNGGNLTYRIKKEEAESIREELSVEGDRDSGSRTGRGVFSGDREREVLPQCYERPGGFYCRDRAG